MRGGHVANAQTTKVQEKSGLVDATCFLKKTGGKKLRAKCKNSYLPMCKMDQKQFANKTNYANCEINNFLCKTEKELFAKKKLCATTKIAN